MLYLLWVAIFVCLTVIFRFRRQFLSLWWLFLHRLDPKHHNTRSQRQHEQFMSLSVIPKNLIASAVHNHTIIAFRNCNCSQSTLPQLHNRVIRVDSTHHNPTKSLTNISINNHSVTFVTTIMETVCISIVETDFILCQTMHLCWQWVATLWWFCISATTVDWTPHTHSHMINNTTESQINQLLVFWHDRSQVTSLCILSFWWYMSPQPGTSTYDVIFTFQVDSTAFDHICGVSIGDYYVCGMAKCESIHWKLWYKKLVILCHFTHFRMWSFDQRRPLTCDTHITNNYIFTIHNIQVKCLETLWLSKYRHVYFWYNLLTFTNTHNFINLHSQFTRQTTKLLSLYVQYTIPTVKCVYTLVIWWNQKVSCCTFYHYTLLCECERSPQKFWCVHH